MRILLAALLMVLASVAQAAVPSPSCVPSRTTGVAPLAVFIDCTGTTDADTTQPFHDLLYEHNFGDPKNARWSYGTSLSASKNYATGPTAAHVFETAGTFSITTRISDGTSVVTYTSTITVTNPNTVFSGTNTICFSNTTSFTGCPAGATNVTTSNFATAINTYQGTGKRLLFNRGDTFTSTVNANITANGPGIIGAFGTGAKPIVTQTANGSALSMSLPTSPTISDWRVMDLSIDGQNQTLFVAINSFGTIKKLLILNVDMLNSYRGFRFSDSELTANNAGANNGHTLWEDITIAGCIITPPTTFTGSSWRIFVSAIRLAIIGNNLGTDVSTGLGSHVVRLPYVGKGVMSNNDVKNSSLNLALKLHAPFWCQFDSPAGTCTNYDNIAPPAQYNYTQNTHPIGVFAPTSGYTEYVYIAMNNFIGATSVYVAVSGPQNGTEDERVRNVIFDGNYIRYGSGTQISMLVHGSYTTVRNNVFNSLPTALRVNLYDTGSPAPPPVGNRVYNNTMYSDRVGGAFNGIDILSSATDTMIKNNLGYGPSAGSATFITNAGVNTTGAAGTFGNSSNAQALSTSPLFVGPLTTPLGFMIGTASYATNGGVALYPDTVSDFFHCIDKSGNNRSGAFVPRANVRCRASFK